MCEETKFKCITKWKLVQSQVLTIINDKEKQQTNI